METPRGMLPNSEEPLPRRGHTELSMFFTTVLLPVGEDGPKTIITGNPVCLILVLDAMIAGEEHESVETRRQRPTAGT
jgi:hypothetical protein